MRRLLKKCFITLTRGRKAVVDEEDFDALSCRNWFANQGDKKHIKYYAASYKNGKMILMHREIMNCPEGMEVDHINGDTLDNRKANLRICTHLGNLRNSRGHYKGTSSYKGVYNYKKRKTWRALIGHKGSVNHIGYFKSEAMAAKAYDDRAAELFGEFAYLNFPKRLRRRNIYRWLMATNGRVFAVIFIKRSTGEEKKIQARVGVKTRQKGKGLRYNSSDKKLIVVYDMKERIYKSIPIDGIEAVICRGKRYRVD